MRSAWSKAFVRLLLPLLSCSAAACSSERSHLDKQLAKLQDEVRHLQSETDRMGERLDAVETRRTAAAPYADERVANNATTVTRPKLKVVHVEPSEENPIDEGAQADAPAPEAAEPDNGPRVVIEGEGKSIESRTLPGSAPVAAKTTAAATKPAKTKSDAKSKTDAKSNKTEAPSSQ